jgi:hypothetical protein
MHDRSREYTCCRTRSRDTVGNDIDRSHVDFELQLHLLRVRFGIKSMRVRRTNYWTKRHGSFDAHENELGRSRTKILSQQMPRYASAL